MVINVTSSFGSSIAGWCGLLQMEDYSLETHKL